jgi:HD domain
MGDRWQHVQAVADEARRIGLDLADEDRDVLVAAAYLHDIGYAPSLNRLGFHPVDGARFLRQHGHERLARLVAHHSGARFEAEERGLLDELAAFPVEDGPVLDALTFADMTTGPAGEAVTLEERVGEILDAGRVAVRRPRILVDYQVLVSEPKTAKGRRSLALDPVTVAALRAHRARQGEERLAVGGRCRDSELVFTVRTGPQCIRSGSQTGSASTCRRLGCRGSGCTTCATATRRRRWPLASRPRWSASGWGTPTSPSPWTPTAMSCPAWTSRPPARSPASSWAPATRFQGCFVSKPVSIRPPAADQPGGQDRKGAG